MFHTTPRRRGLRAVSLCVAVAAAAVLTAETAYATSPSGDFLAGRLVSSGTTEHLVTSYTFNGQVFGYDDTGLTVDAYLALQADDAAGYAGHRTAISNWVSQNKTSYYSDGSGTAVCTGHTPSGELYSGALAKTAFQELASGGDASAELALLSCLQDSVEPGRFSDGSAFGDYSNAFGQSFAIMAFVKAPSGRVAARGASYLEGQQCTTGTDAGSFGSSFGSVCSGASVDATAMSAMALQTFADHNTGGASRAAAKAALKAAAWIVQQKHADKKGQLYWTSTACGTSAANINTTALAVLGVEQVRGAASTVVTRGQAWLGAPAQSPASGEMPGCADANSAVQTSNDVRATTQGILGRTGTTYPDLLGL